MTLRSIPDTIESLRVILLEFENSLDPHYDQAALTELKRMILDRIAELEAELAIAQTCALPTSAQLEVLDEAIHSVPPQKLD